MSPEIIMRDTKQPIKATVPLENKVEEVYSNILDILDTFNQREQFSSDKEYEEGRYVIANHIYLIYERLYLNVVREIDYTDIKNFAIKNNDFIKYIFKTNFKEFSIESLDTWTQIHIDILECAMYRNSNKYNKHVYH